MQHESLHFIPSQQLTTAEVMKAARELLGWKQRTLSEYSGVSLSAIRQIERKPGLINARADTLRKLTAAFTEHGIVLVGDGIKVAGAVRTTP